MTLQLTPQAGVHRPRSGPSTAYRAITARNFRDLPQVQALSDDQRFAIDVVSRVLPFKTNNYVVDQLIDWSNVPDDPIFVLNFPQRRMLEPDHFERIASLVRRDAPAAELDRAVYEVRMALNPHPAGQLEHNVPSLEGQPLRGMQHKYRETVLFFPSNGQTCHAYCTFCFRWPQFVGIDELRFASREASMLADYVRAHPEVSDVLITGGDPLVMRTRNLRAYIEPLLAADPPNLRTIRIGSKALSYWPYRFTADEDADALLDLFREIVDSGRHLALMAHVNHPGELTPDPVVHAIERIRETGAVIRTQSPLMGHINDDPAAWSEMWRRQVHLGMVPYYMFIARDTGARHYFEVPLVRAAEIFRTAYRTVSGLGRTVRGPSMSADPGKVQVLGPVTVAGEEVLALRMLQGRNPDWALRPFFATMNSEATWLDELEPAFGEPAFFFEDELATLYAADHARGGRRN